MKFLLDFLPIVLFFVSFKQFGIFVATGVAIIASILQIAWLWFKYKKVDGLQWASLLIVTVFGGATLIFHNELFIKWKPTILYGCFSFALLGSAFFLKKNLIKIAMEKQMKLPESLWPKLNILWAIFFALMAGLNLIIAFNFSTEVWVNFKLFGSLGLMLIFIFMQTWWLSKYMQDSK